jgi:imidazoleglycerol-phosphate dehydratase/histidinol-phosphatase
MVVIMERNATEDQIQATIARLMEMNFDIHRSTGVNQTILGAIGDKRGIERYGFFLPMDDARAQVALDFSGRSWLVWKAKFRRERIGEVPTEMFAHFFKSFCDTAGCNLFVKAKGQNEHHKIEAIFKAFGRALGQAVRRQQGNAEIPSTKGVL